MLFIFHGAAGWSHFAQFTIAVVNKDPKKSKYSGNVAITGPSKIMAVDDCGCCGEWHQTSF
jgi:hypothetical protein